MIGFLYLATNIVWNKAETCLEMCKYLSFFPEVRWSSRGQCTWLFDLIKHIFLSAAGKKSNYQNAFSVAY